MYYILIYIYDTRMMYTRDQAQLCDGRRKCRQTSTRLLPPLVTAVFLLYLPMNRPREGDTDSSSAASSQHTPRTSCIRAPLACDGQAYFRTAMNKSSPHKVELLTKYIPVAILGCFFTKNTGEYLVLVLDCAPPSHPGSGHHKKITSSPIHSSDKNIRM